MPMLRVVRTPVGLVPVERPPIATPRLVLEPVARDQVEAFVAGDFRGVRCGDDWPRKSAEAGSPPWELSLRLDVEVNWLVTREGATIGDCFTHGGADDTGDIEIGYGLAAPYRGYGYGTELVAGLAGWLILHPEISRVVARNIDADNTPSRRALEGAGFLLEDDEGAHVAYTFAPR
ncbi:MAG TPA: GNAT family N-acetyltransferase [Gaiellaceae bacterium]|nr:GNAT family N-acetyltransferase [Gaiellaceae bacterium]